ncbi:uncharacterized protein DS421_19g644870 [Arachis hypogaea]|uniref:Uncharacterized protein n=1 Tax=Arachis hypogaea TaxID=3818 RepID=A0A6B9V507_ARAHY|nr:uncharacterized protein DS421_19g644870 [Arachis hypogaea]
MDNGIRATTKAESETEAKTEAALQGPRGRASDLRIARGRAAAVVGEEGLRQWTANCEGRKAIVVVADHVKKVVAVVATLRIAMRTSMRWWRAANRDEEGVVVVGCAANRDEGRGVASWMQSPPDPSFLSSLSLSICSLLSCR